MEPPFPPFEPDDDKAHRHPKLTEIPLRTLFPNILTLLAICSGLTSIRFAIENRIEFALGAIVLAAFLDGIDGRVARFLKSTTRFGAQMDSLADFVNFGVAPVMLIYFNMLSELRPFGWVAALVYAMCACLRLARFNVQLDGPGKPDFHTDFFVGIPAPAAAMIVLLPIYLILLGVEKSSAFSIVVSLYVIFVGLLMVSNLPTYSGKTLSKRIPRSIAIPMILAVVIFIAILLSYPWQTLAAASLLYLAALPWGRSYFLKLEAREAEKTAATRKQAMDKSAKKPKNGSEKRASPTKPASKGSSTKSSRN